MAHFDVDFLDKNSERYMLSRRIRKITDVIKSDFFIKDSVSTGDFLLRDGQYTFEQRNEGEWKPFKAHADYWGYKECYCWFKQTITIPESFKGEKVIYQLKPYYNNGNWNQVNPQFIVWINGEMVQGVDSNHQYITVTECAKGNETLEIYINAYTDPWEYKGQVQMGAFLQTLDTDAVRIYYDIASPLEVTNYYDGDSTVRVDLIKHLNVACNMLDIDSGDRNSFRETAKAASAYLNENIYGKTHEATSWSIGHTHIDVAWLWRLRQTRDKAGRSFATVIKLMEEYPDYKFMSSQAQLYDYVKQDYPELFEKIKQKVKEGRWEVEGSMWVEADTNVASGEALVRQFLVGKKFFKEEFGIDNKIMWLPDVFGYSGAIPQLIKKCGMEYFMTTKISWNEYNKFPYDTFMWKGIDGTEVLSHFSPCEDADRDERKDYQTTYNAYLRPGYIIGGNKRYSQKDLGRDYLCTFGFGDGGGGPTVDMLEHGKRMQRGIEGCPNVRIAPSLDFFRHLENQVKDNKYLPKWSGELYLELHRGTLTSQARNKKYNRKTECLFHDVETLSAIAKKETGFSYPAERILENWKLILLNQFHDILPGSSIKEVYEDSKEQYESVIAEGTEMTASAEASLIGEMNLKNDSLVVFNTTGFNRKDAVISDIPVENDFILLDGDKEVAYQKTYDGKIVFVAEIPAKGYKSFAVKSGTQSASAIKADENSVDTKYFKVEFTNGDITKLVHKESGRDVADGKPFGTVRAFQDRPFNHEAWDIKSYFEEKEFQLDFVGAEIVEQGAVRVVYKVDKKIRNSVISAYYNVYADLDRIDVDYKTDWKETHVVLKGDYPVDVNAVKATFDIQFGNLERSTTENTTWDFAQFEVSMHKWVDLSDNSFGVSVINDCKYGCTVKNGHIMPTLLRCQTRPNDVQDREYHEFTFSIYPHADHVSKSDVIKEAFNVNYPAYAVFAKANNGTLSDVYSFISGNKENIVIETVKEAEDGNGIIVRAYESWNSKTDVEFTFCDDIKNAVECNLIEDGADKVEFNGKTLKTQFKPFEIKTFRVNF